MSAKPVHSTDCALSIILCSRNDRYMGNSRWRLETTLNYLAGRLHDLGRQDEVEIVVTDWGSEVPLHTVLSLTPQAAAMVSFLPIPPDIARAHQKDSPFPEVLALNAAARRARGAYIGRIDQDTLVGARFIETFFDLYEGRQRAGAPLGDALLFANRRGIPQRFAERCPALDRVERFVDLFGRSLAVYQCDEPFWASYVGIWLAHRDVWFAARGYDEALLYMNSMEVEMIHRLLPRHPLVDVGRLVDVDFYHLDHCAYAELWAGLRRPVNPSPDVSAPPVSSPPNGPAWGLADHQIPLVPLSAEAPRSAEREDSGSASPGPLTELILVGARLLWDKRSSPTDVAVLLSRVTQATSAKKRDIRTTVAEKCRLEYERLTSALTAATRARQIRAIQETKAARATSGQVYDESPRVAVVVQSFNQGRKVRRLEKRLRATCMEELIVCEDGSIDRSWAKWAKRLSGPNDFLIRSNDLHEVRTYARAIDYSRAGIVCLMQDDDRPPNDGAWLQDALTLFDRYPKLAVVGGWCGFTSWFEEAYNAPLWWPNRRTIPTRDPYGQMPMMFVEHVNIGPYLMRKDVFHELGGFDFSFSEPGKPGIVFESDYCLRVWRHGYQVALVDIPGKERYFGRGGTMLWGRADRKRNEARNKQRLVDLHDAHMPEIRRRVQEANAGLMAIET